MSHSNNEIMKRKKKLNLCENHLLKRFTRLQLPPEKEKKTWCDRVAHPNLKLCCKNISSEPSN